MKKKTSISLFLIICVLVSMVTTVNAVAERASEYLAAYSISVYSTRNDHMSVDVIVHGVDDMNKIGVQTLTIEEKNSSSGSWHYYDTLYGYDNPDEFYDYGVHLFANTFYFNGTPGHSYRVIAPVYAGNSQGSDTGKITSSASLCK